MRELRHRVVERKVVPSGRLADGENWQLVRPSFDRQPILGREPDKASAPSKVAKIHAPASTGGPASGRVSGKTAPPPLLNPEKEQLFQQFLEWRSRQKEVP